MEKFNEKRESANLHCFNVFTIDYLLDAREKYRNYIESRQHLDRVIKINITIRDRWTLLASRHNRIPWKGHNLIHIVLQLRMYNLNLTMRKHWRDTQ